MCVVHCTRLHLNISVFVDLQSSSQSSRRSPSDSQSVDIVAIGSSSKRKAAFPSMGSQRPQKIARTDTSHYPGRSIKETEATSRTRDTFESRSTTTSPISTKRKRRKVILPQNREVLQRLIAPLTGMFTISSLSSCQTHACLQLIRGKTVIYFGRATPVLALKVSLSTPPVTKLRLRMDIYIPSHSNTTPEKSGGDY